MKNPKGQISVELLFLSAIIVAFITGFVSLASSLLQSAVRAQNKLQAFAVAEAGIEYYRWHLAHSPQDFSDGTGGRPGPYVHNYYDQTGNYIGQFSLTITAPQNGSTIVTITSAGSVLADPSVKKIITVKMGIPSFAQYAWVLNDNVYFGTNAVVYGLIDSNQGIHFDGVAHNLVESALTTYTDPDTGNYEWAVYTDGPPADPVPPTSYASQPAIFTAGRQVGVPAVDFAGLTSNLSNIKAQAQASGTYFASSSAFGYDLLLSSSTYTVYKVTSLVTPSGWCTILSSGQTGWGSWSIQTETTSTTGTVPNNGVMFFEDNLWVRGMINRARVTIAAGRFPDNPTTRASITVNNSVNYTNFDGTDTIALISQNNINVGLNSDNNLTLDAALIAQNGATQRYYYNSACGSNWQRNQLTTLGMMGSSVRSGFAYGDGSGYQNRTYNYDANLLYGPPPSFPLSTNSYSLISWTEVQ